MIVVRSFGVSLDGFAAGPDQSLENPLGVRGPEMMEWFFPTRRVPADARHRTAARPASTTASAEQGFDNVGAWILGRNMFGPVRGPWPDDSWKGWWGDEPPYHVPVFVLTHHARAPLAMKGGTTFHFVTDGIAGGARAQARAAAGGRDVRIGGGVVDRARSTCSAGLIDEMHLAVRPRAARQRRERCSPGLDLPALGYAGARDRSPASARRTCSSSVGADAPAATNVSRHRCTASNPTPTSRRSPCPIPFACTAC